MIIFQNFAFAAFVLFVFFAIVQLNYRKKLQLNYFLAGLFLSGGYIFLYLWLFILGLLKNAPFLIHTYLSFILLVGPFFFLYFSAISGVRKYKTSAILLHFVPSIISLVFIIILNMRDPSLLSIYINNPEILLNCTVNRTILTINMFSNASLIIYLFITLYRVFIVFKSGKLNREMKMVVIFLAFFLLSALMLLTGDILEMKYLALASYSLFMLLPAYYMIFSFKYPDFTIKVIYEARNIRYKTSIAENPDTSLIESRLLQLMEEEKIFTRQNLTLQSLAGLLMVTPRKLSQIINSRFQKNFNTFINSYRIEEAKRLLHDERDKSIVTIAFLTGFNSASSFYTYFFRETGESPGDYRAGHAGHMKKNLQN